MVQLFGKGGGGEIACGRVLLQAPKADHLQADRHITADLARGLRRTAADHVESREDRVPLERDVPRKGLVEDNAEGPDIGRRADVRPPFSLLWGHVGRGAHHGSGKRLTLVGVQQARETEIRDFRETEREAARISRDRRGK